MHAGISSRIRPTRRSGGAWADGWDGQPTCGEDIPGLRHYPKKVREEAKRQGNRSHSRVTAGIARSGARVNPKFHMRLTVDRYEGEFEVLKRIEGHLAEGVCHDPLSRFGTSIPRAPVMRRAGQSLGS